MMPPPMTHYPDPSGLAELYPLAALGICLLLLLFLMAHVALDNIRREIRAIRRLIRRPHHD